MILLIGLGRARGGIHRSINKIGRRQLHGLGSGWRAGAAFESLRPARARAVAARIPAWMMPCAMPSACSLSLVCVMISRRCASTSTILRARRPVARMISADDDGLARSRSAPPA